MKKHATSRSRRLRKKLHVGEFQQMGFDVTFEFAQDLSGDQIDQFWDSFIADAIEANQLAFGGGLSGFAIAEGRGTATEAHRELVRSWLLASPEVKAVEVGPLIDSWHSE